MVLSLSLSDFSVFPHVSHRTPIGTSPELWGAPGALLCGGVWQTLSLLNACVPR